MDNKKFMSGEEFKALKTDKNNAANNGQYNKRILFIVAAIAYSVIIFYLGISYQKNHSKSAIASSATNQFSGFSGRGGAGFANRLFGPVTAVNSGSITVQNARTGTTTTVAINSSTVITENQQTVGVSSITVGSNVMVSLNPSNTSIAATINIINLSGSQGSGTNSTL